MKYIVMSVPMGGTVREIPIIFPNILVHANVVEAIKTMNGMEHSTPVSAGEISSMDLSPSCSGESYSLGLKSRCEVDDRLINMHDYMHGIAS